MNADADTTTDHEHRTGMLIRLRPIDRRRLMDIMNARGMTTQAATIRLLLADEAQRIERTRAEHS